MITPTRRLEASLRVFVDQQAPIESIKRTLLETMLPTLEQHLVIDQEQSPSFHNPFKDTINYRGYLGICDLDIQHTVVSGHYILHGRQFSAEQINHALEYTYPEEFI